MSLAKLQWLFLAIALTVLITLAGILVSNQLRVGHALDDLSRSQTIMRTVLMLRILAGELPIDPTERDAKQWQTGMRTLAREINSLPSGSPMEVLLLQTIRESISDADELFNRFETRKAFRKANPMSDEQFQFITDRTGDALQLALGNVNVSTLRLTELEAAEVRAARQYVLRTSVLLVVAMLAILVAYLVIFRKFVLAPINQLQAATDRIAAGELEHRVAMRARNEFGELGQRFDHMTEQLQTSRSRMEAANKELEAFAYSVSHDLRAPLRGMDAFSRILLEKYVSHMDEDARHCLQMIRDNALQMGRLIDDLLAFSRLSQQPLRKEPVQNAVLVQAALQGLVAEQEGRQIELTIGELAPAEADPRLLKQVWVNLIANALKYTRGRDKTEIRIGSDLQNGVPVYFVADNGVGFDMRYAHKLFGVFQRLHRAEDYEGTGVGLAIVQRIITRHGGRIWTQAAKNQGATFYFTLQGEDSHA